MSENPAYRNQHVSVSQQKSGCSSGCIAAFFGCSMLLVIIFMAIIIMVLLAGNGCSDFSSALKTPGTEFHEEHISGDIFSLNKIVVIPVNGVIMQSESSYSSIANADTICKQIKLAKNDEDVKAVIISLDTPGGEVTASDIIHHEIQQCAKVKPVIAIMNSMAASGGYYIASACNKIVAHKTTLTGSIGVIIQTYNYAELFNKVGLKSEAYTSGAMKNMLDGSSSTRTPEEIAIVQGLVNSSYMEFVNVVSEGRSIPVEKIVGGPIGDGRVFSGQQAYENGLVDIIGYFKDAVNEAVDLSGLEATDYEVIRYYTPFSLASLFQYSANDTEVNVNLPGASQMQFVPEKGKMYYLPFHD